MILENTDLVLDESILDDDLTCLRGPEPAQLLIAMNCCNRSSFACENHYARWLQQWARQFGSRAVKCEQCGADWPSFFDAHRAFPI